MLADKVALVVGAGQTPGQTIGNGRATAIQFAREGATVVAADRYLESAQETADKDDEYEAFLQGNGAPSHCLLLCSRLGYRLILAARVQGFYQGRRNALVIDFDRYSPMSCGPPRPAR